MALVVGTDPGPRWTTMAALLLRYRAEEVGQLAQEASAEFVTDWETTLTGSDSASEDLRDRVLTALRSGEDRVLGAMSPWYDEPASLVPAVVDFVCMVAMALMRNRGTGGRTMDDRQELDEVTAGMLEAIRKGELTVEGATRKTRVAVADLRKTGAKHKFLVDRTTDVDPLAGF